MGVFLMTLDTRSFGQAGSGVERDGNYMIMRLLHDIHSASSVVVPATAGQTANQLQVMIGGINYTFGMNGSDLQLTNNLGVSNLNSYDTNVSNFSVQRVGNTLKINFDVSYANGKSLTKSFNTTVGLR
jgi:hypothetical protein